MTRKSKTLRQIALRACQGLVFCALLCGCAVRPARAQFLGFTSPQSVQQTLAAAGTACTGSAQIFTPANLGQTQHYVQIIPLASPSIFVEIDGLDNAGNIYRISDLDAVAAVTGLNFNGYSIAGFGYYAKIQVSVTCAAASGSFTLSYSGTSNTGVNNVGSYQTAQIIKQVFNGVSIAAGATSPTLQTPFGNTLGTINLKFGGGAALSVAVNCLSPQFNSITFAYTITTQNVVTVQSFPIPAFPCPILQVTAGAAATTIQLEYIFTQPGLNGSPPTGAALNAGVQIPSLSIMTEKGARWDVLSTPAAGGQGTASKTAGTNGARHVADCVSYSAGAIAAPAATALQINLRDGATGAGTIIWSKTVTIPATAAPHYDGNFCGLNLIGAANTAMTLEFSAALANESQSVTLTGYDVQ
jgi:hypothetical protein